MDLYKGGRETGGLSNFGQNSSKRWLKSLYVQLFVRKHHRNNETTIGEKKGAGGGAAKRLGY